MENNTYTEFKGYLTDVLGNKAVNFIDIYSKSDNPFFLYLSFNAPHTPMEAKKDVLEKFKNNPRKTYASMMWSMDQAIGNVIEKLKNDGVYDNTIIYFLSDNGAAMSNGASSFPYKGWKGNQYEGGIKTPMIMTWKNRIKPNTTYNGFISSLDIFKTSVTIAKIEDSLTNKSDGKNIMNLLTNPLIINEDLYWRKDKMASVRSGNYKLIRLNETNTVLYNLKNNFHEDIDIKNIKKYIHDSLLKKLLLWEGKLTKPNWTENKDWDLVTQMIYEDLMSNSEIRAKSPNDLKNN
jgi:arylsulfatase A-like enzyme